MFHYHVGRYPIMYSPICIPTLCPTQDVVPNHKNFMHKEAARRITTWPSGDWIFDVWIGTCRPSVLRYELFGVTCLLLADHWTGWVVCAWHFCVRWFLVGILGNTGEVIIINLKYHCCTVVHWNAAYVDVKIGLVHGIFLVLAVTQQSYVRRKWYLKSARTLIWCDTR